MSNKKFNIFKSSKVYIQYLYIYIRGGVKRCCGCMRWFFFAPALASVKTFNKYSCRYHCKAMSKSPLLLFVEGKTSTKILPHPPLLKITFRLLCVRPEEKRGFFLGNKSTKIKTKRIQKRIGRIGQKGLGPTRFYGRFFFSSKWRQRENNIIFYSFYYQDNQDYTEQNELQKCK